MQKSQRKSHPLNAIANVGINSNSSETSVCAEKNRGEAPARHKPNSPASRFTPQSCAQNRQSASIARAIAARSRAMEARFRIFASG
jgi:hypothetical protein